MSRQRIKGSDQVLYEFTYHGAAYTGDFTGLTVLDSSESLVRGNIQPLTADHFCAPPAGNTICMTRINYERRNAGDTLRAPLRAYVENIRGIRFNVTEYSDTYGSATFDTGLMRYEFDGVSESADSLTLSGVSKIFGGHVLPPTVTFEKGNVWINDSADLRITAIRIDRVINKRGNIYKPTSPFEIVPDQPIVGVATYEFIPRSWLSSRTVSDYGVWKQVR